MRPFPAVNKVLGKLTGVVIVARVGFIHQSDAQIQKVDSRVVWNSTVTQEDAFIISSGNGPSTDAVSPRLAKPTNALALFYTVRVPYRWSLCRSQSPAHFYWVAMVPMGYGESCYK